MAQTRVVLNRAGIAELMRAPELLAHLRSLATRAAEIGQASAPHVQTGRMLVYGTADDGANRARAAVIARHPAAIAAERRYHWLTHAVEAAGLRVSTDHLRGHPASSADEQRRRAADRRNARQRRRTGS
jgi:hypothetical protein